MEQIEIAIRASWSAETADHPDLWSPENPARCQCGSTAIVVRELLGGEILAADVSRNGERVERHAWNRLPTGEEIDLTRSQFRDRSLQIGAGVPREPRSQSARPGAHELLLARTRARLALSTKDGANAKR
ncbi:MAG: YunG family protein [Gaiellaceae bacterium]